MFLATAVACRTRRRRVRRAAALAATVLLAVGVSVWLWRREPAHQPLETNRPTQVTPLRLIRITPTCPEHCPDRAAVQSRAKRRSLSAGRPPTTYERFLFAARTRKPVAGKRPSVAATIDEVIERLTRDPDADAEQLSNRPA